VKPKFVDFYFDIAEKVSTLSYARRLKVGAVIVKDHRILSYGYNGTPAGYDNNCEIEIPEQVDPQTGTLVQAHLVTKPEVIHAEMNALTKLAKHGDSCNNAVMFITHAPCIECAKLICQTGISGVYYRHQYRFDRGIVLLKNMGIQVIEDARCNLS
jgi:dCMP deaminase